MEPGIVLGIVLAILLVLSVPIAMCLGLASLAAILVMSSDFLIFLPQKFLAGIDSFTLLAIPLFILAGTIMGEGGIAHRIIDLAMVFVGRLRGGLGMVSIISTMFFSGVCGSASADTAAIGSVTIPAMKKKKYPGKFATAKVTVDATGGLTDVTVMDGGSAYAVGNRLHVVGIATTTTLGVHTSAIVTVTEIYDNTGDVVRLTGVTSETYNQFNSLYRITEIGVGAAKSFRAASDVSISGVTTAGIGTSPLDNAAVYVTGESLRITNLSYETNSGIATLTSSTNHGLRVNSKVRINTGITTFNGDPFEGSFVVTKNVSATQFAVRIGAAATTLAPTSGPVVVAAGSSMFAFREGFVSSDGIPTIENESLNGRMQSRYAGITTTLSAAISDAVTTSVSLTNVGDLGVRIGDYLMIDDEIVRVKGSIANPATNPASQRIPNPRGWGGVK